MSSRELPTPRGFVVVLIATAVVLTAATTGPTAATDAPPADLTGEVQAGPIAVSQNGQCLEVSPYGTATRTVEQFYDYRSPNTNPSGELWGSYGTRDLQVTDGSVLLFYEGADGISAVIVHDEVGESNGGTVSFEIEDIPDSADVAVEDDSYDDRVDNFDYFEGGTRAAIDWKWGPNRSDGIAIRGVDQATQTPMRIEPRFNDDADKWDSWNYAGPEHRIEGWYLRSGDGNVQKLNMTSPLEIRAGGCPGNASPMVTFSHGTIGADNTVQLEANASYSNGSIAEYQWDLTGNGETDETNTDGTATKEIRETGLYTLDVTVVTDDGTEVTVQKNLIVEQGDDGTLQITNSESSGGDRSDETTTDPGEETTTDPGEGTTTDPGEGTTTDPGEGTTTGPGDGTTTDPETTTAGGGDGTNTTTDDTEGAPGPGISLTVVAVIAALLIGLGRRDES